MNTWKVDWSLDKWHLLRKVTLRQKAVLLHREKAYFKAAIARAAEMGLGQDPVVEQDPVPD